MIRLAETKRRDPFVVDSDSVFRDRSDEGTVTLGSHPGRTVAPSATSRSLRPWGGASPPRRERERVASERRSRRAADAASASTADGGAKGSLPSGAAETSRASRDRKDFFSTLAVFFRSRDRGSRRSCFGSATGTRSGASAVRVRLRRSCSSSARGEKSAALGERRLASERDARLRGDAHTSRLRLRVKDFFRSPPRSVGLSLSRHARAGSLRAGSGWVPRR